MTEAKADFGVLFKRLRKRRTVSAFAGPNKQRARAVADKNRRAPNAKLYKYRRRIMTAKQWALYCNITVQTFKWRVKQFRRNPRKHPPGWIFRRVL